MSFGHQTTAIVSTSGDNFNDDLRGSRSFPNIVLHDAIENAMCSGVNRQKGIGGSNFVREIGTPYKQTAISWLNVSAMNLQVLSQRHKGSKQNNLKPYYRRPIISPKPPHSLLCGSLARKTTILYRRPNAFQPLMIRIKKHRGVAIPIPILTNNISIKIPDVNSNPLTKFIPNKLAITLNGNT